MWSQICAGMALLRVTWIHFTSCWLATGELSRAQAIQMHYMWNFPIWRFSNQLPVWQGCSTSTSESPSTLMRPNMAEMGWTVPMWPTHMAWPHRPILNRRQWKSGIANNWEVGALVVNGAMFIVSLRERHFAVWFAYHYEHNAHSNANHSIQIFPRSSRIWFYMILPMVLPLCTCTLFVLINASSPS